MDFGDVSTWLLIPVQILFVDLLLGADNALVIALACRSLTPTGRAPRGDGWRRGRDRRAIADVDLATWLLSVPFLQIAGALALILIAMNLSQDDALGSGPRSTSDLWSAAAVIVVADAAMGLDNVVALAAIARGNFWLLAIGIAFSVPILAYGGLALSQWLARTPALVALGAALLGWIAGGMALADPVIAPWADANAPGLVAIAPLLGAAFVYLNGRMGSRAAPADATPRMPPQAATPTRSTRPAPTPASRRSPTARPSPCPASSPLRGPRRARTASRSSGCSCSPSPLARS